MFSLGFMEFLQAKALSVNVCVLEENLSSVLALVVLLYIPASM